MLLHIDGSEHRWFQDERWYDLLVILDDANSEIYYAQLVEEEATATVLAGLKAVVEQKGVFCALYSDRGSHFWLTPKAGAGALAGHAGGLHRDRAPTPGWNLEPQLWAARLRSLRRARRSDPQPETGVRQGRGKDARRGSAEADV